MVTPLMSAVARPETGFDQFASDQGIKSDLVVDRFAVLLERLEVFALGLLVLNGLCGGLGWGRLGAERRAGAFD